MLLDALRDLGPGGQCSSHFPAPSHKPYFGQRSGRDERLLKHNLNLSPSKARLGATDANFLGHSISPAGLRPNEEKVSALINMPMPTDVKQVRALMGGINYYLNFLPDLSKRLRPINSRLRKGVKFAFTPAMEKLVLSLIHI